MSLSARGMETPESAAALSCVIPRVSAEPFTKEPEARANESRHCASGVDGIVLDASEQRVVSGYRGERVHVCMEGINRNMTQRAEERARRPCPERTLVPAQVSERTSSSRPAADIERQARVPCLNATIDRPLVQSEGP
jgi:hypothetical protein